MYMFNKHICAFTVFNNKMKCLSCEIKKKTKKFRALKIALWPKKLGCFPLNKKH